MFYIVFTLAQLREDKIVTNPNAAYLIEIRCYAVIARNEDIS